MTHEELARRSRPSVITTAIALAVVVSVVLVVTVYAITKMP